ncbi:MAG: PilZ domain-containing protein [Desulfuromonadales bacterium]
MINAHFSLAPKRDFHLDCDDIISLLGEYRAVLKPVEILNYYRELPITSISPLELFGSGKFKIKVTEMQMQVISNQMQAVLLLDGTMALADCSAIDIAKSTVVISGFQYINLYANQREAFRLSVNTAVDLLVDFRIEQGRINGLLIDISVTGCKVKINTDKLLAGSRTVLEIQIYDQHKNKELCRSIAARVVHVYCSDDANYCCLEFIGSSSDKDLLANYLSQKQIGLLRDFRQHRVLA